MRRHLLAALTAALAGGLACCAAAGEVTTFPGEPCTPGACEATRSLTFTAFAGEVNDLVVAHEAGGATTFVDAGAPLRVSGRCRQPSGASVDCEAAAQTVIDLGDGDDRASMAVYGGTLHGGDGDDHLEATYMIGHGAGPGDRFGGLIDGGAGDDRVAVVAGFEGRVRCGPGTDLVIVRRASPPEVHAGATGSRRRAVDVADDDCERLSFPGGMHVTGGGRCATPARTRLLVPAVVKSVRVVRANLRVDGVKSTIVRRGGRLSYRVDLRKLRGQLVTVSGVLRASSGATVGYSRTLRVCD